MANADREPCSRERLKKSRMVELGQACVEAREAYEREESLRVNLPMAPSMLRLALPALLPLEIDDASEPTWRWALGLDSLTKLAAPPRPMW